MDQQSSMPFGDLLDLAPNKFSYIAPGEMPEPYRFLLAHDRDMTGRLEAYHGKPIHLKTLKVEERANLLYRKVLLVTADEKTVEFGAIQIHLNRFDAAAREAVLGCYQPLGGILREHRIPYRCELGGLLRITAGQTIDELFQTREGEFLYGRRNRLVSMEGTPSPTCLKSCLRNGIEMGSKVNNRWTAPLCLRNNALGIWSWSAPIDGILID